MRNSCVLRSEDLPSTLAFYKSVGESKLAARVLSVNHNLTSPSAGYDTCGADRSRSKVLEFVGLDTCHLRRALYVLGLVVNPALVVSEDEVISEKASQRLLVTILEGFSPLGFGIFQGLIGGLRLLFGLIAGSGPFASGLTRDYQRNGECEDGDKKALAHRFVSFLRRPD